MKEQYKSVYPDKESLKKGKVFLVITLLVFSALAFGPVLGSQLPKYAPTAGELQQLGIQVKSSSSGLVAPNVTMTLISGEIKRDDISDVKAHITIMEYGNGPEKANEVFQKDIVDIKTMCSGYDDNSRKLEVGTKEASCYVFSTGFQTINGKKYKFGTWFGTTKLLLHGQYIIKIQITGDWDGIKKYAPDYTTTVCITHVDGSTDCTTNVDEAKYSAYLKNLDKLKATGRTFSETLIGNLINLILPRLDNSETSPSIQVSIIYPKNGQVIYFEPGKGVSFVITAEIKAPSGDLAYAGAHYESSTPKIVMVGGELQPRLGGNGGRGSVQVTLSSDEVADGKGLVKVYARDSSGNEVQTTVTVYLREKGSSSRKTTTTSTMSTTRTTSMKPITTAGDPSKFKEPPKEITIKNKPLSSKAKMRMKNTQEKIRSIGKMKGLETAEIKTPYGADVKVLLPDPKIPVRKGSALHFKLKYYGNKYGLDTLVDKASDGLDSLLGKAVGYSPLGLFKDYVKAFKDSALFKGKDATKKTQMDLHVSETAAEVYNNMSGIEERETSLSPLKNAVPSKVVTKPFEYAINSLGTAVKKSVAQDYEWEFRVTARTAMKFKKAGMKYRDIIKLTINDVEEETSYDHKVQTLNAQSKGKYKNQEARIRFYINKLFSEGKL